jgi:hypothetical protein
MLIANFELRWLPTERTHFRLRVSNLETQPLEYALDFFLASNDPGRDLTSTVRSRFVVPYYTEIPGHETAWRRVGERYLKSVHFTVRAGATQSVVMETAMTLPDQATQGWFEGYAALRLPGIRGGSIWSRFGPQIDHPARVLLAAEALLEQEAKLGSVTVLWPGAPSPDSFVTRPHTTIVHSLPLASGSAEILIEPEGQLFISAIAVDAAYTELRARLTRGDAIRVAEGLEDVERLVLLLDELQRLGADSDAFDAINTLLEEQQCRIRLCRPN